jgi:DNA-directed RNA polymerase sigma subunit (sigma70/sigma32)
VSESKPQDPVEEYLRQIEAVPPLTAEEERALWTAMDRGDDDADSAKRRVIEANLRLVLPIAARYEGRGMTSVDLAQEGNLGLLRAVEKFDPSAGLDFVPFANRMIEDAIANAIG